MIGLSYSRPPLCPLQFPQAWLESRDGQSSYHYTHRPRKRSGSENGAPLRIGAGSFSETRFVKGVFSKQSHSSPWKQHITGFPRGIFRKIHNLYLSANPSIYGYVISLPFIFAYSAKLLRAFAKPTISDSFNVQITDSHSLIHFFVCFICSSEI